MALVHQHRESVDGAESNPMTSAVQIGPTFEQAGSEETPWLWDGASRAGGVQLGL